MMLLNKTNVKFIFLLIFIHRSIKLESSNLVNSDALNNFSDEEYKLIREDTNIQTNPKSEILIKSCNETHGDNNNKMNTSSNFLTSLLPRKSLEQVEESAILQKQENLNYNGEYTTIQRQIKFYISKISECSVSINDVVLYKKEADINFIEHWILHNNVKYIEPKSVTSNDIKIKYFSFSKAMNIFSVYFEELGTSSSLNEFSINFQYDAINLINTYDEFSDDKDKDSFFIEDNSGLTKKQDIQLYNYNEIIWKFFNKNYYSTSENLGIELIFDLGSDFEKYFIYSQNPYFHFTKKVLETNSKTIIVKYSWTGPIESQEVLIMDIKLPLYFDNCRFNSMNIIMISIGSIFIIFVILMLYIIFSSAIFNDI